MALPYVVLAWFPAWRRILPRPGAWMVRLKELLAFPLYATVAWLVWVLGAQVGNDAVMRIGATLVLVAFALWAWRVFRGGGRFAWATAALVGAIAGAVVAWPLAASDRDRLAADGTRGTEVASDGWEPYSAVRVADLVAQGRPVFVDFTAAWCVTCQVNKRLVLADASVRSAFARADTVLLRADSPRSRDHARACRTRPQRRSRVRPLSQGRRPAPAAGGAAAAGADRRDLRLVARHAHARGARNRYAWRPFTKGETP
jgi:thiol:disulfide interchange protein DsbD